MDERDKPLDDVPGALYRALPRDEPPPATDAAVLAAARRSVEKRPERKWAIPVSLAAVLVLSIGVTLRVADERPDAQLKPVTPPPAAPVASEAVAPHSPAPAAISPPRASEAARTGNVQSVRGPNASSAPERKEERTIGALSTREGTESAPFVPSPRADTAQPIAPSAASAADAPAERSMARRALRSDAPAAQEPGPPMMAKSAKAESSLAAGLAPSSPEAWLERIAEMRAQGRHKEADETYAEFRQRFPGYTIAPEMLRKISPPH